MVSLFFLISVFNLFDPA